MYYNKAVLIKTENTLEIKGSSPHLLSLLAIPLVLLIGPLILICFYMEPDKTLLIFYGIIAVLVSTIGIYTALLQRKRNRPYLFEQKNKQNFINNQLIPDQESYLKIVHVQIKKFNESYLYLVDQTSKKTYFLK